MVSPPARIQILVFVVDDPGGGRRRRYPSRCRWLCRRRELWKDDRPIIALLGRCRIKGLVR